MARTFRGVLRDEAAAFSALASARALGDAPVPVAPAFLAGASARAVPAWAVWAGSEASASPRPWDNRYLVPSLDASESFRPLNARPSIEQASGEDGLAAIAASPACFSPVGRGSFSRYAALRLIFAPGSDHTPRLRVLLRSGT